VIPEVCVPGTGYKDPLIILPHRLDSFGGIICGLWFLVGLMRPRKWHFVAYGGRGRALLCAAV